MIEKPIVDQLLNRAPLDRRRYSIYKYIFKKIAIKRQLQLDAICNLKPKRGELYD